MTRRRWLLTSLGGAHLVLVTLGAAGFLRGAPAVRLPGAAGAALNLYRGVSGAFTSYGFFAPDVPSPLRARFELITVGGERLVATLQEHQNREAIIRTDDLVGVFWKVKDERAVERAFAASWAGKMFHLHPDAKEVSVKVEGLRLPAMRDWRRGERARWPQLYEATFLGPSREAAR